MSVTAHPGIIRATVATDGRLLAADAPLLALQREAGGDLETSLAIPQLAAIVRLATRLGITISRPIIAASDRGDIDMWVRAQPGDSAVHIAVIDWSERGPTPVPADADRRDADLAALSDGLGWAIDPQLQFRTVWDADEGAVTPPVVGSRFTAYFRLEPDVDGEMPMLGGFAQRRAFRDQPAVSVANVGQRFLLSGFPTFDLTGRLMAYRGRALPIRTEAGPDPDPLGTPAEPPLYPVEFGRRLDRSLRQPLGRIIANADTIQAQLDGPLRADYAGYASDIATAGRHLLALVDDLADLQAIDRPDFTVAVEEVDLADLARRAVGLLAVKALDRHIAVSGPGPEEAVPATGEFRRVLQILVNLIGNALRYSPERSSVRVIARTDGRVACVLVIDQGAGVPEDSRERIFEKFERLGRDDPSGSGLGLYISRRLARAMGGDVSVDGATGHGACFMLTLQAQG